jgi:hypothetical protein
MKNIGLALSVMVSAVFAEELNTNAPPESTQEIKAGNTNQYTRAMFDRDRKSMSNARKKRTEILSKRQNMKDKQTRADVVRRLKEAEDEHMSAVRRRAVANGLELQGQRPDGRSFRLIDFDDRGFPVYEEDFNVNAAITTAADQVRSSATFNGVDGSSVTIGLWESGGIPRVTHQELSGKITVMDGTTDTPNHATHVAGTLVSRGINAATLGMAPGGFIAAFSSSNAESEMTANGAVGPGSGTTNLYLSNHSYGVTRGWKWAGEADYDWTFGGTFVDDNDPSTDYEEDFGRYNYRSEDWDGIAYNFPYYLVFVSAGNGRQSVPDEGDTWKYGWDDPRTYDSTKHPAGNAKYKNGYDNMEGGTLAKNVMAIGWADDGIDASGNRDPVEAKASIHSCRGPVDDGRIKPDIYGNGQGLMSSIASGTSATASYSGTSMSSPNCCGSAALLIDYFSSRFPGEAMRASTLKALILHTADDRNPTGPDYKYGWGIMNTKAAADVIKAHADNQGGGALLESSVDTTVTTRTRTFGWDGTSPLRVTLCWTDPPGTEIEGHDNRAKALVNDLNLKVIGPDGTHYPYVMPHVGDWSVASIGDAATTGVNDVDNVEQVYVSAPMAGDYQIVVDYVGNLTNDEQIYSLVVTGQDGLEYTEVETWRLDYFGTTNASGDMADGADYDEDGIANLMEFGLATSPTASNADPTEFEVDPTEATLSYPLNLNSTNDYDFEMIWSDNLMSNNWSTMGVVENILSTSGIVQQVESSLPVGTSSNRYFRLQIKEK